MAHTIDERTRLLRDVDEEQPEQFSSTSSSNVVSDISPTPLPWRPLMAILFLFSIVPLTFELVFPFVNQMILEIGVVDDPEKVGFYSGLIESIFACTSFVTIMPCAYFADRIGRKPVILFGISGLAISVALFGLSKSYWFMVVTRCLGGALGGTMTSVRIMLAEITDKSNQGGAFSGLTISYRVGQIVGQPLGGLLSHPERHSSLFQTQFWYDYPYSLPCFVSAAFALVAVALGFFLLEETLASKRKASSQQHDHLERLSPTAMTTPLGPDTMTTKREKRPSLRSVLTPSVVSTLLSTIFMVISSETVFALYPLFAFTPVISGGLGKSEATIGTHMAVRALTNVVVMMAYAPLQRRFGTVRLYQLSMAIWPVSVAFFPILNYLALQGVGTGLTFNTVLVAFFVVWSFACNTWTGIGVMVNDVAPSSEALAAINGISQMVIVLPQGLSPAFITSLFAFSIKSGIAHGYLTWIVMLGLTLLGAVHSLTLKEPTHDWRQEYKDRVSE